MTPEEKAFHQQVYVASIANTHDSIRKDQSDSMTAVRKEYILKYTELDPEQIRAASSHDLVYLYTCLVAECLADAAVVVRRNKRTVFNVKFETNTTTDNNLRKIT